MFSNQKQKTNNAEARGTNAARDYTSDSPRQLVEESEKRHNAKYLNEKVASSKAVYLFSRYSRPMLH